MKYLLGILVLLLTVPVAAQFAEPNDRGVTFSHMHVVVEDLELHKRLWPRLFDAELVEKHDFTAVRVADALIFFRQAEPTAASADTALNHFGLRVSNLEDVLSKWQALGYEVDSMQVSASGSDTAFITMPGGIRLALTAEPGQPESTTMGHVQLATPVNEELVDWYVKFFGFVPEAVDGDGLIASIPGTELRFEDSVKDRLPTDGAAIDHIGFEVRDWEAFVETLQEADTQFEFGPAYVESLDIWVAFFNDPAGVLVEISSGLDKF